ncbi:MAG TPA: protein kinase [Alphaproteobacteria bacterium]|jgi:hypothetical protein
MTEEMRHALPKGYEIEGYRMEKVLGAGGFGITYLAHEISINRKVAIKEYLPNGIAARGRDDVSVHPLSSSDRENFQWGLERFRKEAQTLVTFHHSNIVTVYRYFEANGTAFLVMAYEDGESLAKILERAGTLTEEEINDILVPLLSGLEHVHKAGFLHRDIKPGNIYIRRDGSPVLLDFGAARQALGGRSQSLTSIVSAGYAPFEQYTTRGNQGPWTDIYAFGGVLYRATTGDRPPDSPDRIRDDPYVPAVKAAAGKYSETLLAAIDAALEVDEAHRPQNVAEWRALFAGQPLAPRPEATPRGGDSATLRPGQGSSAQLATGRPATAATAAPRQRRGVLAAAVIAGGLLVLGGAGAGTYFYLDAQGESQAAEMIGKARAAMTAGALDEAERLIADAEKAKKDHPDLDRVKAELKTAREAEAAKIGQAKALLARARAAIARRDFAEAERLIDQAAKLAPNLGDVADVRTALKSAQDRAGAEAQVRALLTRAREAIGRRAFDEAERLIAEAAKLSPGHADLAAIREELRRAKETSERSAQVQRLLAQARDAIRAKNFPEAERLIQELARLLPANASELATIRSELEAARRGSSDAATLDRLLEEARDAIAKKDFATARRKLDEAARISPSDAGLAQLRKELADAEAKERPAGTDYSKVTKTPTNLCRPGTQKMIEATRKLSLPPVRYCTDADWNVRDVRAEGANLRWRVPFTDGYVDCSCVRGTGGTTTDPTPGQRTAVPGVTKTPLNMCQPGSARYVNATRALALPGQRYCATADWNVRQVQTDGVSLYWQVIFSDGHVNCQCTRSSADAGPTTPKTTMTAIPGVTTTPNNLCVAGTQRMVRTMRKLTLPSHRYCTDSDWRVNGVATDGANVYWNVPFEQGAVACACRKR